MLGWEGGGVLCSMYEGYITFRSHTSTMAKIEIRKGVVSQGLNQVLAPAVGTIQQGNPTPALAPVVPAGVPASGSQSQAVPSGVLQTRAVPQGAPQLPQAAPQQPPASAGAPKAASGGPLVPGEEVLHSAPHPVAVIFRKPLEAVARHHVSALVEQLLLGHRVRPAAEKETGEASCVDVQILIQ